MCPLERLARLVYENEEVTQHAYTQLQTSDKVRSVHRVWHAKGLLSPYEGLLIPILKEDSDKAAANSQKAAASADTEDSDDYCKDASNFFKKEMLDLKGILVNDYLDKFNDEVKADFDQSVHGLLISNFRRWFNVDEEDEEENTSMDFD